MVSVGNFIHDIRGGLSPTTNRTGRGRWLTMLGTSGTGKTYVARKLWERWKTKWCEFMPDHGVLQRRRGYWGSWPKMIERMRSGDYSDSLQIQEADFVVIDEIGATRDPTGFAKDQLFQLTDRLIGKWAVLTGNVTMRQLGDFDTRIPSRIIRDDNECVQVNTVDYALRGVK